MWEIVMSVVMYLAGGYALSDYVCERSWERLVFSIVWLPFSMLILVWMLVDTMVRMLSKKGCEKMKYSYGIDTKNWNIGVGIFDIKDIGRVYRITFLCFVLIVRWSN